MFRLSVMLSLTVVVSAERRLEISPASRQQQQQAHVPVPACSRMTDITLAEIFRQPLQYAALHHSHADEAKVLCASSISSAAHSKITIVLRVNSPRMPATLLHNKYPRRSRTCLLCVKEPYLLSQQRVEQRGADAHVEPPHGHTEQATSDAGEHATQHRHTNKLQGRHAEAVPAW
jgi:hypothetical protein